MTQTNLVKAWEGCMKLIFCSIMKDVNKKIKTMFKFKKFIYRSLTSVKGVALISLGLMVIGGTVARADFTSQINNLQNQNVSNQAAINSLQLQATSYQNAISQLQTQIADISNAISANQAKQVEIQQEIQAGQLKLSQEKQILSADIESMYVNSQMTTIEELATSQNLSDFVDAQVYRSAVQTQVQNILTQVMQQENQLSTQKNQVNQLLQTQQAQQNQLASNQQQQQSLLSYNQTQQAQYNQQIANNQSKIATLEAEQAALNERNASAIAPPSGGFGGNCATPNYPIGGSYYYSGPMANSPNGGYPMAWCNAPQDSLTTAGNFPSRECTSFAYWYFTAIEGHSNFQVTGNANQWWYTANRPVDQTPAVGSIAVDPNGYYGHVMIVIADPGQTYDGRLVPPGEIDTISMNDDWHGHFFAMQRPYQFSPSSGLTNFYFIH